MSDLIVRVLKIDAINPHPNADNLELAIVGGWQVATQKGNNQVGGEVIHIPPDALVPFVRAEEWGVAAYLSGYDKWKEGKVEVGRVKAIRLRGEVSHGFIIPNRDGFPVGDDVKDFYGITKWEPAEADWGQGNMEKPNPHFGKYTDIQNIRNFSSVFSFGEPVVATEKIHGTSGAIGLIKIDGVENVDRELMVGSRNHRRKIGEGSLYEQPLNLVPGLEPMLTAIYEATENAIAVICYGEIYGWVQDLRYGHSAGSVAFAAFDISVNGKYMSYDEFNQWTSEFSVPVAPLVYTGPFDNDLLWDLASGMSLIPNADNIREGIVVKPLVERTDPKLGRVTLKMVSDDYLTRKGGTENH